MIGFPANVRHFLGLSTPPVDVLSAYALLLLGGEGGWKKNQQKGNASAVQVLPYVGSLLPFGARASSAILTTMERRITVQHRKLVVQS